MKELFKKWGSKVFLAVADQGVFSGTNFILNILLARWLQPHEYGSFVLALSIFLFISGFHNALILEPMNTVGVARFTYDARTYVGKTIWLHFALTLSVSILLLSASIILDIMGSSFAANLYSISTALPLILLLWLLRTTCYIKTEPYIALRGSAIYFLLLSTGMLLLKKFNWLSPSNAFLITGFVSVIVSIYLIKVLGLNLNYVVLFKSSPKFRNILSAHWRYGRWVSGSAAMHWLSGSVYLPMVGFIVGLSQLGALRAVQNLVLPLDQIMTAIGMLLLPWFAMRFETNGKFWLKRRIIKVICFFFSVSLLYIILMFFSGPRLITILYGDKYSIQYNWMIPYLCIIAFVGTKNQLLYIFLKTFQKPNVIFLSQTCTAIFSLTIGTYLVWRLNLLGCLYSLFICSLVNGLIMLIFFSNTLECLSAIIKITCMLLCHPRGF